MKKKRVVISFLTSILLVMQSILNPMVTYADVNNENTEQSNEIALNSEETKVKELYFNKNELKVGETLEIFARVENVPEGSHLFAHLWFPENQLYYELNYNAESRLYTTSVKIEEAFKYITIDLIGIEIRNDNGNFLEHKSNLSITVADENGIIDKEAPIINSVNINKNEFTVGEELEVSVEATDDVSGIKNISSAIYVNGEYKELKFTYDEANKIYKGYFLITEELKGKTIKLTNVVVIDNSYKSRTLEQMIDISVLDDNGNKDNIKPVLNSVKFDKDNYKAGETLKLYIDAYDNESGIKSVEAYVKIGQHTVRVFPAYGSELKKYVADIYIEEFYAGSKITFGNIIIYDNAENYDNFNVDTSAYVLTSDGQADQNAPMVSSIEFSKDKLMLKDILEITLEAEDDISGIDEINAILIIGEEKLTYSFLNYDEGNKYSLVFYPKEYMYFKDLKIEYIEAIDYAGNVNKIEINKIIPIVNEDRIINDDTDITKIIEEINETKENKIDIFVNNKEKIVDKAIFEAIAGSDKIVSFILQDGTVWTFRGRDIAPENIDSIKLSISNVPSQEAKNEIEKLTDDAIFLHFDYHGVLPGKASIKIKVDNNSELLGKIFTLYYYNSETKKVEKISSNRLVDIKGYITIEIDHCSDYFLSENTNLLGTEEADNNQGENPAQNPVKNPVDNNEEVVVEENVQNDNTINELPKTGGINTTYMLVLAFVIAFIGDTLIINKKKIN